jgi:hypothetical protein
MQIVLEVSKADILQIADADEETQGTFNMKQENKMLKPSETGKHLFLDIGQVYIGIAVAGTALIMLLLGVGIYYKKRFTTSEKEALLKHVHPQYS